MTDYPCAKFSDFTFSRKLVFTCGQTHTHRQSHSDAAQRFTPRTAVINGLSNDLEAPRNVLQLHLKSIKFTGKRYMPTSL